MNNEDIEPPTPDVDRLYRDIVANYKVGKYSSQEEALAELKKQHEATLIDIKKELHEHFEYFAFYRYIKCEIDDYIRVCEKIENSPSAQEREDYEKIIRVIIDGVKADCDYYGKYPDGDSDVTATLTVRNEVDKIRALCRENRKREEIYEQCKAELESILQVQQEIKQNEPKGKTEHVFNPALMVVFSHFRQFQQDYETLKTDYITEITKNAETVLKWEKSKVSLAQYFGIHLNQKSADKNKIPWKEIEILFGVKGLKNSYSGNDKKPSKDFVKLQEALSSKIPL